MSLSLQLKIHAFLLWLSVGFLAEASNASRPHIHTHQARSSPASAECCRRAPGRFQARVLAGVEKGSQVRRCGQQSLALNWFEGRAQGSQWGGDLATGRSGRLSGRGGAALQPVEVTTTPFSLLWRLVSFPSSLFSPSLSSLVGFGHAAHVSHRTPRPGRLPFRSATCAPYPTGSGQIRQVLAGCTTARPPSSSASWATPQPFPLAHTPQHFPQIGRAHV